ncbi:MAG: S-formylglutathione hydrolase [Thermodesulfobacteriota bacterium]
MAKLNLKSRHKSYKGYVEFYTHDSESTFTEMTFSVYRPECETNEKVAALFFLSGLTCNEENFITKSGAIQYASEHKLMLICPDTSPRGTNIPGEFDNWDLGSSAGFYVNATTINWNKHYRMYDYVAKELPELIFSNFKINENKIAISGHSMGGHGALIIGLRNPEIFRSISAFAPICAPSQCPWGVKAFTHYLGEEREDWQQYDASELIKLAEPKKTILIDQGTADKFLDEQLNPEILLEAAMRANFPLKVRMQEGYDHSYYFISTFIKDHIEFHLENLNKI